MFFDNTVAATTAQHELAYQLQGDLYLPDTLGYDEARLAWNRAVDQHPALIVVALSTADVVAAVRYANAQGLKVAVQSTGHGVHRAADGALLIVTARMTAVRVNAAAQSAWVEAGAEWGMVLEKAQQVGLAPLLGSSPNVGVVGYTLGGGMGWLARQYGLATDSVHRFEVVTADGEVRTVSKYDHPDLFWGLRGGGGSLAIITGLEIQLYPVTTVYAGNLIYPASMAKEVILRYREWIKDAPDALTSSFALMNFPPLPEVPDFLRGQSVIMVRGCYNGPVSEGEALIQPWLDWQTPIANLFGPMPFTRAAEISNDPLDPMPVMTSGAWLRELSDEAIATIVHHALPNGGAPVLMMTEVRHAGGAISRVPLSESPIAHREAAHLLLMVAAAPTLEAHSTANAYAAHFKAELQPALDGVYLNFLDGPEARARTRDAYTLESYLWLRRLKAKYDAQDRFSHSFDIRPL